MAHNVLVYLEGFAISDDGQIAPLAGGPHPADVSEEGGM